MHTTTDESLEQLYRDTFPAVAKAIARLGGDLDAAKDIFHDALVIYIEKQHGNTLDIKTSSKAYLTGIAKILWIRKFNHEMRHTSFDDLSEEFEMPKDFYEIEKTTPRPVLSYLESAGKKCLELLRAFYYEQQSLQEITAKFHYKSRHSATVQKHKCLEKVRNQLKTSSVYEETVA
jgi:DNA-directed RNA polymerase specialized sigma24 family protein